MDGREIYKQYFGDEEEYVEEGSISVGETVKVVWNESKKKFKFNAIILSKDYGSNINSDLQLYLPKQLVVGRQEQKNLHWNWVVLHFQNQMPTNQINLMHHIYQMFLPKTQTCFRD